MHRRARAILGDDEDARDVMQEVFVRVLSADSEFRGEAPVLHWIYRITTNLSLDRLRRRKTWPTVQDPDAVLGLLAETSDAVDRRAILQVLAHFDAETQQIAVHYYLDALRLEDVAAVVGLARKTVSKRLEHFRTKARRLLGGER